MNTDISDLNKQLIEAVNNFKTRTAKKILKEGADPNTIVDQKGKTVLMDAAHRADTSMVKTLIKYGADINLRDKKWGFNALLFACSSGCLKTVKTLQNAGSDILSVGNDLSTGLMQAAFSNKHRIIQFLIDQGININAQNDKGQTALIYSLDNCKGDYSFMRVAEKEKKIKNKFKTVRALLKMGADVNLKDNKKNSVLTYTVSKGCLDYTELLIKNGADINISKDNLLYLAEKAPKDSNKLKELLKQNGAKPSPFTLSYRISIVCKECGKYIPMNGPFEKVKCDSCYTETKISELDVDLWEDIFESSINKEQSYSLEETCKVDLDRSKALCSKCATELDVSAYKYKSEEPLICENCGKENNSFPAPDFLKEYTVNDLVPQQIFCSEKEGDKENIDQEEIKPIAFQCVSCAASLYIKSDTPRNCTCEHCGTGQYLPDPLWQAMHPVKKREKWYIYFSD